MVVENGASIHMATIILSHRRDDFVTPEAGKQRMASLETGRSQPRHRPFRRPFVVKDYCEFESTGVIGRLSK